MFLTVAVALAPSVCLAPVSLNNAICLKSGMKLVFTPTSHVRATGRSLLPVAWMLSALGQDLCSHHHAPADCLWPVCLQEKPQLCNVCGHACLCTCAGHRLTSDIIRQVLSTLYFETGFWFYLDCTSPARLGGK